MSCCAPAAETARTVEHGGHAGPPYEELMLASRSVGDGLRLTFVNCVEEGVTSNGVLGFNLTLVSEASTGAKVTFDNLALNDGTDTIEADGGFNLTVTDTLRTWTVLETIISVVALLLVLLIDGVG